MHSATHVVYVWDSVLHGQGMLPSCGTLHARVDGHLSAVGAFCEEHQSSAVE